MRLSRGASTADEWHHGRCGHLRQMRASTADEGIYGRRGHLRQMRASTARGHLRGVRASTADEVIYGSSAIYGSQASMDVAGAAWPDLGCPQSYTPIAALTRARVNGRSRMRVPVAALTALAIAAAVGPAAASPVPRKGWPGRSMTCTSRLSGTAEKRRIG